MSALAMLLWVYFHLDVQDWYTNVPDEMNISCWDGTPLIREKRWGTMEAGFYSPDGEVWYYALHGESYEVHLEIIGEDKNE